MIEKKEQAERASWMLNGTTLYTSESRFSRATAFVSSFKKRRACDALLIACNLINMIQY